MSDRIPCINPRCRRTAPAEKYGPGYEIVCRKCFRDLPRPLRDEYRRLKAHARKMDRLVRRRVAQGTIAPHLVESLGRRVDLCLDSNWRRIRAYYQAPERPVGLDNFLEEVGL